MNKTIKTNINTTKQMLRKAKEISILLKRLELAEREYIYLKETEEKRRKTLKREYENVSQKVVLDERSLKIIELRKKGMTLKEIANCITTREGNTRADASNYICEELSEQFDLKLLIPEATKQGYAIATEGDGVYINRPHQKREVVQKGMIQTIKTSGDDIAVVVSNVRNVNDKDNIVVVGELRRDEGLRTFKDDAIGTLRTKDAGGDKMVVSHPPLRIRKLTPKECWRLMGFSDEDFEKASKVNSNAQLYKQAGNSIVVNVLEAIFKELL